MGVTCKLKSKTNPKSRAPLANEFKQQQILSLLCNGSVIISLIPGINPKTPYKNFLENSKKMNNNFLFFSL